MAKVIKATNYEISNSSDPNRYFTRMYFINEFGEKSSIDLYTIDVLKHLDCTGIVNIRGMKLNLDDLSYPGRHINFAWIVACRLWHAYRVGEITKEEFIAVLRYHYDNYYLKQYFKTRKLCEDFYARYFSAEMKERYPSPYSMFEEYSDIIEAKGKHIYVKRPGEVYGFFYDSYYEKTRPLTGRVYYEALVPDSEKLWICFLEEIKDRREVVTCNM